MRAAPFYCRRAGKQGRCVASIRGMRNPNRHNDGRRFRLRRRRHPPRPFADTRETSGQRSDHHADANWICIVAAAQPAIERRQQYLFGALHRQVVNDLEQA